MQQSVLEAFPSADIGVSIVWINILGGDTEMAAKRAAAEILPDPRVHHFYDPEKRVGEAIARSLGGEEGKVAWDIYLFYKAGSEWAENPPTPIAWMHQLTDSSWADHVHYHSGDDMVDALYKTMKELIGK